MREITTETEIDVPPETVWDVLTDLPSYPEWNPHIPRANGDLRVGAPIDIVVRRTGVRDRSMTVTITELEPERRLAWVGRLLSPRLFEGRHVLELEHLDGGRTRLVNREVLSGVFARFATTENPETDYEAMNEALKRRAEQSASPSAV
jgi:hypothetical protein